MASYEPEIDFSRLFKLRAVVARFGEMDVSAWWNTKGVLGKPGALVYSRGLNATHSFAQVKVVCAVAAARCQELFDPPGSVTLWSLAPEIEDRLEAQIQSWMEEPKAWREFFERLQPAPAIDLLGLLESFALLAPSDRAAAEKLRRSAEGRAVPLPGEDATSDTLVTLLAAGFFRGEPGQLAVPYAKAGGGSE